MRIRLNMFVSEFTEPTQILLNTRILHALTIKTAFSNEPFHTTKLIRFYAINNDLTSARNLFNETTQRSIYPWNSIIRAYAKARQFSEAFILFNRLLRSEVQPDNYTFACIIRACSDKFDIDTLKLAHGKVFIFGLGLDFVCNSALVSCYSKLGHADEAGYLFTRIENPDLVLWNTMISVYGIRGDRPKGLELFKAMRNMGIRPDGFTMVGLITGIADQRFLRSGETIHGICLKYSLVSDDHVGSALVSMYSRCKDMDMAGSVFDCLVHPDLVSWSALIAGLSQAGDYKKSFAFFRELVIVEGRRPDPVLLASVLSTSAQSVIFGPGCEIHGYAVRQECDMDITLSSALVDMYTKCGFLDMGMKVFKKMPVKNIVSYNTIISGLGLYGHASEAFSMFEEILEAGLKPDGATFAGILSACCHAGLVKEGNEYFKRMRYEFGVEAETEHHVYMVKLLGTDGRLEEAFNLIKSLPEPVNSSIWGAMLSCFEIHKNDVLFEIVAAHLFENKQRNCKYSVMLSNLLAGDGRWDDVEQLRVQGGGAKGKMPGISWIAGVKDL